MPEEETREELEAERWARPRPPREGARIRSIEELEAMPISVCMRKGVVVLDASASVRDAARAMEKNNIGSVIVTEKGKAAGIVTERDIVRKIVARKKSFDTKLKRVMSAPLKVIEESKSIRDAVMLMRKHGIKKLPIIDAHKRLIGFVTETDIVRAFPGIIDLLLELSNITRIEATTETVGICGKCGLWSETLQNVHGEFLCEECREAEAAR